MGPALMNNCKPKFQTTKCLKRCGNGDSQGIEMSKKRRCFHSNNDMLSSSIRLQSKNSSVIELGSSSEDEDQNIFVKFLGEKNVAHSLEDDIDLGYKIFLEHLREDGKSYIFEMVNARDGKPIYVKYEGDDLSSDEGEIPLKRKSGEGESQNQKSSNSISSKGRRACLGRKNKKSHTSEFTCHEKNKCSSDKSGQIVLQSFSHDLNQKSESLVDENYQTFLNHVRVHGYSLILELEDGVEIKYEEETEVFTEGDDVLSDEGEISRERKSEEGKSKNRMNSNIISSKGRKACLHKKNQKSHMPELTCHEKNKSSSAKSGQITHRSVSPDRNRENESSIDKSYQTFLNHVRVHDDTLVLELENGVQVKYEEENEICNASEGSAAKTSPCCSEQESEARATSPQPSNSSIYEEDVTSLRSLHCSNHFQFKEELMACLNKPFDWKEHDKLLNEVKAKKSLERRRDLRSRSISYPTGRKSSSYLDYYPDLANQIMFAEPHSTLTLLRGFFFWLKNLSHEGAFMPWSPALPSKSAIVPVSSSEMNMGQMEMPEGSVKEEIDIQPIRIEIPEDIKEETDIQSLEILT